MAHLKRKDKGKGTQAPDSGRTRLLLLSLLVVVGTGGAILLLGGGDEKTPDAGQRPSADQEVLEITPLVPAGSLANASWHRHDSGARVRLPDKDDGSTSLLEDYEFHRGDEGERRERYEKSLAEKMNEIHGLGVYVAPAGDKPAEKAK